MADGLSIYVIEVILFI